MHSQQHVAFRAECRPFTEPPVQSSNGSVPSLEPSYYRARYYDPESGRFLGEDPFRYMTGENFYAYVGNNPVNYVDSWGLCSNDDVKKIVNAARNAVNDMTLNGDRIYNGNLNNIISTERHVNPFAPPPYKGCGEQTDNVINKITPLKLDCNWQPDKQYTFPHGLPHQWASYSSGDPNDPTIALDPWNNRYQLVPPGSALSDGSWHPLVPYVNNPLNNAINSTANK